MQLTRLEIAEKLKEILILSGIDSAKDLDASNENLNLSTDVGLTSIGMLYTVIAVEETFNIRFDDVGMGNLITLGDVLDCIEAKLK